MKTYRSLCTQFYDITKTAEGAVREISFYTDFARDAAGPLLEPMCGSGRILLPLLHAGFDIEGFDASAAMLEALRHKHAQLSDVPAPVWQQFMQDFSNHTQYALIIIPFGSFGLLTNKQEAQLSLNNLYAHLQPGGTLIVEIDTVYSLTEQYNVPLRAEVVREDGALIALTTVMSYSEQSQIFTSHGVYELIAGGEVVEREEELFEQYIYQVGEMDQMLAAAGFYALQKYKNYDYDIVGNEAEPRIVYVAQKAR